MNILNNTCIRYKRPKHPPPKKNIILSYDISISTECNQNKRKTNMQKQNKKSETTKTKQDKQNNKNDFFLLTSSSKYSEGTADEVACTSGFGAGSTHA